MLDADGNPVPCADALQWGVWFETADRNLCQSRDEAPNAPDIRISTVFLGLDANFWGTGPPILWETLVFGGPLDGEMERYTSKADAVAGHQRMCARVAAAVG
jgi:hypothetical protein